ncbi:hypothetical protein SZN_06174 [Streptomyces zinciresistens K42]|uniref:Uncharacterized protein n=1 Tax=Streptomyces zinciresistens K42 TaxID=700597 RepID=G2G6X7_9ACTN|nr:hypothetical protein SZN_06174 [Streptomyces zinciresistens K42]
MRDWFALPFARCGDRTAFAGFRVPLRSFPAGVPGFGAPALKGLAGDALRGHRAGWWPPWSPYRFSDHPPRPGLWAVEPHLGFRGTGAKFEEIRVVTGSADPEESAFRPDDDLPHVRRWAEEK